MLLLALGAVQSAGSWASPLPAQSDIDAALEVSPELGIARAQWVDAQAVAQIETSSPQPWLAKSGTQSRSVTGEPGFAGSGGRDYREWDLSLEHTVRLPGKRPLDRSVAALEVARAEAGLAQVRRAVTAELQEIWYQCVASSVRLRRATEDQKAGLELSRATERRLAAGEAAPMEVSLAGAERAGLDANAAGAAESLRAAQDLMTLRGLPASCDSATLDEPPVRTWMLSPRPADDPTARLASAAAELEHVRAARARAERHPDPSVGLRYAQERGGLEKIVGIYFTVPLPGGRSRAEADHADAQAHIADSEQRRAEWELRRRIDSLLSRVRMARVQWAPLNEAATLQATAAHQAWRAFVLGEADLAGTLLAQRAARAARAAADDALIEVWRTDSLARLQAQPATVGE